MVGNTGSGRTLAYVGCYPGDAGEGGGIATFEIRDGGASLRFLHRTGKPPAAGYLVHAPKTGTLYAVDERKTDGRGPVGPAGSVHALRIDSRSGELTPVNQLRVPGPFPTYLDLSQRDDVLVSASHGSFDHVERVFERADGSWDVEYLYDSSTVTAFDLGADGAIRGIRDLRELTGHGLDPNGSPQAGGHGQASAHAHCATIDPSGSFVLVCDKATDRILVYRLGSRLDLVAALQMPPETGPRHVAFDPAGARLYATLEFASQIASFAFDSRTGSLALIHRVASVADGFTGPNEPAEIRVHPNGRFVYANNRGEDSVAWFGADDHGRLTRLGSTGVAKSLHPGVAARSFAFGPDGSYMIVADRPANLIRSYRVDAETGALTPLAEAEVPQPAFIAFATLPSAAPATE